MTQKLLKPVSSIRKAETNNTLFKGIWIRWWALTEAERFTCANIILLPFWWVTGLYQEMPLLLLLGVALYEWWQHKEIHLKLPSLPVAALLVFATCELVKIRFTFAEPRVLGITDVAIYWVFPAFSFWYIQSNSIRKRPSLPVVALLAFGMYQLVKLLFTFAEPGAVGISDAMIFSFCPAFFLWHIQSNNIRIRFQVVAWALTVSVVQMIGFWLALQFFLPETFFLPPHLRNLSVVLTGEKTAVDYNANKSHYLVPYTTSGPIAGLPRLSLFFQYPEFLALVTGFIGLVALDLKNRLWSWLLLVACIFLIFLSATRAVWLAFPLVIGLRYLLHNFSKPWVAPIVFGLIAIVSFTALSLPPATDLISDSLTQSAQSVNELRENSTELRLEIYRQTWEGIQANPLWGYSSKGPAVDPNVPYGRVGSHSLILGRLLYLNGFVGTVLFGVFWVSLLVWLYQTRAGRPLSCFWVLIFYTLVSPSLELVYEMPASWMLIVLCTAIRHSKQPPAINQTLYGKLRYA